MAERRSQKNPEVACITALAPASDGALLVANGSAKNGPAAWKRDLMEKNASGSVWRIDPRNGAYTRLAGDLAYPYGLLEDAGSIVVSESWRSALTRISPGGDGRKEPALENLPAYPSRLSRADDKTIWLALFAPRSQLVEFVLSEDRYRRPHDPRDRRRLLGCALSSLRRDAAGADAAGRRQTARRAEAVVAQSILRTGRPSRSRLSSGREPSQPRERAPARRHQLSHGGQPALLRRQGRRSCRLAELRGFDAMTGFRRAASETRFWR